MMTLSQRVRGVIEIESFFCCNVIYSDSSDA